MMTPFECPHCRTKHFNCQKLCGGCESVFVLLEELKSPTKMGFAGSDATRYLAAAMKVIEHYREALVSAMGPSPFVPCKCGWSLTKADYTLKDGKVVCFHCGLTIGPAY